MKEPDLYLSEFPDPLPDEPMRILGGWLAHATRLKTTPNPNAMLLATIDQSVTPAQPDARVVLCKEFDTDFGCLVFYTNYHSTKGRQLEKLPQASVVFHWDSLNLQGRVRGPVSRTSDAQSDEYFNSRPLISRLGAWASKQSQPVHSRKDLLRQLREIEARFGVDDPRDPGQDTVIPRPAHWGGFCLWAEQVELWIGQRGRLHERGRWQRELTLDEHGGHKAGNWRGRRLQP